MIGAGIASTPLSVASTGPAGSAASFHRDVAPLLQKYCYDCHADGINKGKVAFDEFESDAHILKQKELWLAALKNVRAGIMPPREEGAPRPTPSEIEQLARWIKYQAFEIDPANPDPGRVTLRRLNRVEYRNTIRDLMGIDFNAEAEFPPDDSGHGFDNISDVLTLSPLLLEKYLAAAEAIVDRAVPKVGRVMREQVATGREFRGGGAIGDQLSARKAAKVSRSFRVERADTYEVAVEVDVRGTFDFDPARCRVICRIDGEERFAEQVAWSEPKTLRREYEVRWDAGEHVVSFEVEPLGAAEQVATTPPAETSSTGGVGPRAPFTNVLVRVASVRVRGPISPEHWQVPAGYRRFFPAGEPPADPIAREQYARDVLRNFATRAFRRPVEDSNLAKLVAMARAGYEQPGQTFEQGVGRAMMAVLASPRFVFRIEAPAAHTPSDAIAPVDDYALASRLSYFLWSSMPDDELFALAQRGALRTQLRSQVDRMLRDARAQAFIRNFTGQWLQARDVEFVPINARVIGGPNAPRNREGRVEFDSAMRKLMRSETEMYFEHVLREDRSLLELIDSDYTFLNERLAAHYGIPGVTGEDLRKVQLPADSVRGGLLTQGTMLTVTSNPTRTSPVKRGLFVLDNILGTPAPPAPGNLPDLEESRKVFKDREPKVSEMLAVHRENPLCHSCHARMDPLGLAFENFNALGIWRDTEVGQPIEAGGQLITGEQFSDIRELKRVLAGPRRLDVYRCVTEKLLTYALGRGIEFYDTETVDRIVAALEAGNGRMSALLMGVIESAPFQRQRVGPAAAGALGGTQSQ